MESTVPGPDLRRGAPGPRSREAQRRGATRRPAVSGTCDPPPFRALFAHVSCRQHPPIPPAVAGTLDLDVRGRAHRPRPIRRGPGGRPVGRTSRGPAYGTTHDGDGPLGDRTAGRPADRTAEPDRTRLP